MTTTPITPAAAAGPVESTVEGPDPGVDPAARRRPPRRLRLRRGLTPYLFLLAPLALLLLFTYLPVEEMVRYSFTSWDGISPRKRFVGLDNYVDVFTRPDLAGVFLVSLYYLGASVVQMVLALYFATILSFKVRLRNLFKGIIFFPFLINTVAIGMVFLYVFQPGGTLDSVLHAFGADGLSRQWLGDPGTVNYSMAATSVWRYLGLNFVIFLGAIQSIPPSLYESSQLDGASRWQQFRYIILPGIKPVVGLSFILAIAGSLNAFEIPYIMLLGANDSATFVIKTVQIAFKFHKIGLASAMAVVLLAIILLVTWVQRRLVPDERVNLS